MALAREIFEQLKNDPNADAMLMIGRSRDVDRDRIIQRLSPFRTGEQRDADKPLFIVATQCLEVGVDLDLDGLVTQAASLDALRQRFGRLNRAGRSITVHAEIMVTTDGLLKKAEDPVYGDRIRKTWEYLQGCKDENDAVDFGVAPLDRQLAKDHTEQSDYSAQRENAPVLMPAYLNLWAQTSPIPVVDPAVELFLHGITPPSAEVSIVWRNDIAEADFARDSGSDLEVLMRLVPPRAEEAVTVPLWVARKWLAGAVNLGNISDAPGRYKTEDDEPTPANGRKAFRWAGFGEPRTATVTPAELKPNDLLVVPASYGGCDEFGWAPDSELAVEDVADRANEPFQQRRHAIRVARHALPGPWQSIRNVLDDAEGVTGSELVQRLLIALADLTAQDPAGDSNEARLYRQLHSLDPDVSVTVHYPYAQSNGVVLVVKPKSLLRHKQKLAWGESVTEDDRLSMLASTSVTLEAHSNDVRAFAHRFAQTLGLPAKIAEDLSLAAYLHDAGKADERFQLLLAGASPWNLCDNEVLAKSGSDAAKVSWGQVGLPKGWRHEALSVQLAQLHQDFQNAHDPALVLWLIGTHHGLGRPFFMFANHQHKDNTQPGIRDCLGISASGQPYTPGPQSLAFDFQGTDWSGLYEGLKQRYGVWGLAHLEAMLRLADHRASESPNTAPELA